MKEFNLDEYLKNPSQKVVTRDGRNVRIICTDRKSVSLENLETKPLPIVALVFEKDRKQEGLFCYYEDGRLSVKQNTSHDLFFAPTKKEGWVNIYQDPNEFPRTGNIYEAKEEAIKNKDRNYIATVKIEWEE